MSGLKVRSNAVESVYRRVNPDDWDGIIWGDTLVSLQVFLAI